MANKKVYFHRLNLTRNGKDIKKEEIKEIFENTIKKNQSKNGALAIEGENEQKITMDRLEFNDTFMFCRLGKEQDIASLAIRDKERNGEAPEDANKGGWIDKLTYLLINYDLKLVMVVNNQSAPRASVIKSIFSKYNDEYGVSLQSIPNDKYYRNLYSSNSTISKIKIKVPMLVVKDLQEVPGLSVKEFNVMKDLDVDFIELTISAGPRKKITKNEKENKKVIEILEDNIEEYETCEVEGSIGNEKKHTFNLKDEFFSFNISVDHKKIEDKRTVYKLPSELGNEYREKLIALVKQNMDFLSKFK